MDTEEKVLGRDIVKIGEFPSSKSPSWRSWLLKLLSTTEQLNWNYETCCQMMSESLRGAVFNALLKAKISIEVELGDPSVIDVLSRTSEIIGVSQIELIEERFLLELRHEKEENIADYARRVGAFKTLALETFSDEHWASNCLSGLNNECLRDVVRDHAKITLIVRELERQDSLEQPLNGMWAKMHRVRRRHTEPQAQEEIMPTGKNFSVAESSGSLRKLTILSKEKQTRSVADVDNSNAAQRKNKETNSESIAHTNAARVTRSTSAWKASYWGGEYSDDDCDDFVGDHEGTAHRQPRRSEWCSYSSQKEWSDEKHEIWSELDSDDHSHCPYQPLTLEEALRQIEDGKKTRLAGKKTDKPTLHESRFSGMSGPVFGEWINGGTESLRPACEVGSGKIRDASVCFERRIQLTDQKSLVIELNEIRTGSVAVLYWKAVSKEMKVMAVDRVESYRAKMIPERCSSTMMPIQETLMRKNEAAEPSLVFNVSPGEAIVQRVWVEYDVEMTVKMNHINWSERGLIESAVVRLNHEAAAANFERMSAERTTLSSEGCSFILEVPTELSQRTDETWEVESGKCPIQEVECVFKTTEALAGLKLECVKQGNHNGMHVQKTEAERPSHGVQTFVVDDELQWDPRHNTRVARAAWVQVNVLYAKETT